MAGHMHCARLERNDRQCINAFLFKNIQCYLLLLWHGLSRRLYRPLNQRWNEMVLLPIHPPNHPSVCLSVRPLGGGERRWRRWWWRWLIWNLMGSSRQVFVDKGMSLFLLHSALRLVRSALLNTQRTFFATSTNQQGRPCPLFESCHKKTYNIGQTEGAESRDCCLTCWWPTPVPRVLANMC